MTAALAMYEVTRQRRAHRPDLLLAAPEEAARTYAYFLRMHEHLGRRNKRLRKERARQRGKILPARISGVCAPHQRRLMRAIKQARNIALLPFGAAV